MLTKQRQSAILTQLHENGSVTLQDLCARFGASESTIRRDLNDLDQQGKLTKVFGGAVLNGNEVNAVEKKVAERLALHKSEKETIACFAATLIEPGDFVYIDAGTTTGAMIPHLKEKTAVYVTNAVSHGLLLSSKNFRVILIGGELKSSTEAIVGSDALTALRKFNFTKGFFGTNALSPESGFTTPDTNEALVKETALYKSAKAFVLTDSSKFGKICPVKFGDFNDATIITDACPKNLLKKYKNIELAV